MRKSLISFAAAAAALAIAAPAAAAPTTFVGDYNVTLNSSDPGLQVFYKPITSDVNGLNFTLNQGQTKSLNLFTLYTTEAAVNGDDLAPKPINVAFSFTLPEIFGGAIEGATQGTGIFTIFGIVADAGKVTWADGGSQVLTFGNGGKLLIDLDDATFNAGLVDLAPGAKKGAKIAADFTLLQSSGAVPEPASWALMITGFGLAGTMLRQRRRLAL